MRVVLFVFISVLSVSASAELQGAVQVEGSALYASPSVSASDVLCRMKKGQGFTPYSRQSGSKANYYGVIFGNSVCGTKKGYVMGPPFSRFKMNDSGEYQDTAPVIVRSSEKYRPVYMDPMRKSIACRINSNSIVYSIGPYSKDYSLTQVKLPSPLGCKTDIGYMESSDLVEENLTDWAPSTGAEIEMLKRDDETDSGSAHCLTCIAKKDPSVARSGALSALPEPYSTSSQVEEAIQYALKNKYSQSKRECILKVREALQHAGLIEGKIGGTSSESGARLEAEGFVNLMGDPAFEGKIKSPYDAPRGAVLVYLGGAGHVELKVGEAGKGGFVSDYYSDNARTGSRQANLSGRGRTLVGVYIKDMG